MTTEQDHPRKTSTGHNYRQSTAQALPTPDTKSIYPYHGASTLRQPKRWLSCLLGTGTANSLQGQRAPNQAVVILLPSQFGRVFHVKPANTALKCSRQKGTDPWGHHPIHPPHWGCHKLQCKGPGFPWCSAVPPINTAPRLIPSQACSHIPFFL